MIPLRVFPVCHFGNFLYVSSIYAPLPRIGWVAYNFFAKEYMKRIDFVIRANE